MPRKSSSKKQLHAAAGGTGANSTQATVPGADVGRPAKKPKLMLEDGSDSDDASNGMGGVALPGPAPEAEEAGFKINAEYARRFEYNKKREEVQQCELSPFKI